MSNFGIVKLYRGAESVSIAAPDALPASYSLRLPLLPPSDGQEIVWDGANSRLLWRTPPPSGEVDSIASLTPVISVGTASRVAQIDLAQGNGNLFLGTPDGVSGKPLLRAIAANDVPSLPAGKISTGTLSIGRIPSGTNAQSWQIDADGFGIKMDATSATLATLFQSDGITLAELRVGKIIADIEQVTSSTTIDTSDTKVVLNSDYQTGTPTEDLGLVGTRGDLADAQLTWIESLKRWAVGTVGAMLPIARVKQFSFTNGDLSGGKYTFAHNLNTKDFTYTIWMESDRSFFAEVRAIDNNNAEIDLTAVGAISGTWRIVLSI